MSFITILVFFSSVCLCCLIDLRLVPHSARWLLVKDRTEEAITLLRKAAQVNGRPFPSSLQVHLVGHIPKVISTLAILLMLPLVIWLLM